MLCWECGFAKTKNLTKVEIDDLIFVMPNQKNIERKTAAIMFTDIAGYTEAMSQSEQKALDMLRKKRTIIKTLIDNYNGQYVKEIGDGTLSYFDSGFNASACAKELQKEVNKEDLKVRVGIHIGDIVFDDNDVYGDGVNIASRLESLAPAGGVLVSRNVYDELINKDGFDGVPLGLQSLKGVGRLVEVYAIKDEYLVIPKFDEYKDTEIKTHKDDEVPSLAIIPFENKGADEDVFYAYGISADIISDCSKAGLIRTASLKDVEKVENFEKLRVSQLSNELDVRYIAQGTLWKLGEVFQLSIELYDTKEQKVIWSDRWQEKWEQLSEIKDNLSEGLIAALDVKNKTSKTGRHYDPDAYEFYLKGKHKFQKFKTESDILIAKDILKKSIEIDPSIVESKLLLCSIYTHFGNFQKSKSHLMEIENSIKDVDLDPISCEVYSHYSTIFWQKGDIDKALEYNFKCKQLSEEIQSNELLINALNGIGVCYHHKGENLKSIQFQKEALKIIEKLENKKQAATLLNNIGWGQTYMGLFDEALKTLKKAEESTTVYSKSYGHILNSKGNVFWRKGDYANAMRSYNDALDLHTKQKEKRGMAWHLGDIGKIHYELENFDEALKFINQSIDIQKSVGFGEVELELQSRLLICLANKRLNRETDLSELSEIIDKHNDNTFIDYDINYRIYQLIEDRSYFEKSLKQVKRKLSEMNLDQQRRFTNCPIPKQILSEKLT